MGPQQALSLRFFPVEVSAQSGLKIQAFFRPKATKRQAGRLGGFS